jgi:hypothetical protein
MPASAVVTNQEWPQRGIAADRKINSVHEGTARTAKANHAPSHTEGTADRDASCSGEGRERKGAFLVLLASHRTVCGRHSHDLFAPALRVRVPFLKAFVAGAES